MIFFLVSMEILGVPFLKIGMILWNHKFFVT